MRPRQPLVPNFIMKKVGFEAFEFWNTGEMVVEKGAWKWSAKAGWSHQVQLFQSNAFFLRAYMYPTNRIPRKENIEPIINIAFSRSIVL